MAGENFVACVYSYVTMISCGKTNALYTSLGCLTSNLGREADIEQGIYIIGFTNRVSQDCPVY